MDSEVALATWWSTLNSPLMLMVHVLAAAVIFGGLSARFNQIIDEDVPEPFHGFKLSQLTSKRRFWLGLGVYLLLLVFVYVAFLRMGPHIAAFYGIEKLDHPSYPLILALVLAGAVPSIPLISRAETGLRRLSQRVAGVPPEHWYVARKIASAQICPNKVHDVESDVAARLPLAQVRGVVFDEDYQRLLKCYVMIRSLNGDRGARPPVNRFIAAYAEEKFHGMVRDAHRRLTAIEASIAEALAKHPNARNHIRIQIQHEIGRTHSLLIYLLSCAIVAKTSPRARAADQALANIGFRETSKVRRKVPERFLLACIAATVAVLVVSTAVNLAFYLLTEAPLADATPERWLVFAFSFAVMFTILIGAYILERGTLITRGRWFKASHALRPRLDVMVASFCVAAIFMSIAVALLDAFAVFIELDEMVGFEQVFSIQDGRYFFTLMSYVVAPLLTLVVFALVIEVDHQSEFKPVLAGKLFARRHMVIVAGVSALFVAACKVVVDVALQPWFQDQLEQLMTAGVAAMTDSYVSSALLVLIWYFCAVGVGVYAFLHVFISSGQDVHEQPGQATSEEMEVGPA